MTIIGFVLIAFLSSFTAEQAQPEGLTWSFRQSAVRNSRTVTFSSTAEAGLRRSFDGGKTWEQASVGLTGPVVAIAAALSTPAVFYCGTELDGIFRSDDYGLNWKPASAGLPVPLDHVTSAPLLAVDSLNSQWVYTVLTVPVHFDLSETSLYRSSDGGRHWMLLKELPGTSGYTGMVLEAGRRVRIERDGGDIVVRDYSETPDRHDNTLTLLGQEWGHRFLAYARFREGTSASLALLGRDLAHWSYFMNSEASAVEGNEWRDNGDGSYTATDDTQRYGRLDHYLMGLRPAADVPNTLLLTNPEPVRTGTIEALESTFGRTNNSVRDSTGDFTNSRLVEFRMVIGTPTGPLTTANTATVTSSGFTQAVFDARIINTGSDLTTLGAAVGKTYSVTKLPASTPRSHYFDSNTGLFTGPNVIFRATPKQVTMADIIAQEGPRIPDVTRAQKNFRHAFILVVPKGRQPSNADLTKLANMRRAWESYYADATAGLGSVSTSFAKQTTNELQSTISSNGGWAYTGSTLSSTVNVGYGTLDPGAPGVSGVAVFTTRSGSQIISEAGVSATGTVLGAKFFVERTQSVNTGFAAIAPVGASTLTLELLNESGTVVATTTVAIPAGGHVAKFSHELFTNFTFPPSFVGSIRVSATTPVAVTVLRTIVNQLNEFLVTTLPIADSSVDTGVNPLYLAQVADSGGYQTELLLVNPTTSAISGTAEFFRPDGTAFSLTVNGVTSAIVPYQIPANGATVLRTSGAVGGQVNVGYLVVRPGAATKAPIAGAVFSLTQNGLLVAATGVIPSTSARRVRLFFDRNVGLTRVSQS